MPKLHIRDVPHDLLATMSSEQLRMLDWTMSEVEETAFWRYHCAEDHRWRARFKRIASGCIAAAERDEDGQVVYVPVWVPPSHTSGVTQA